jgi:hypothetical protein
MNPSVVLFFVFNILAALLLGLKFAKQKNDRVFNFFGIALVFDAIAFAVWSFGVISPANLLTSITIGTVFFLISIIYLFRTSIHKIQSGSTQALLTIVSILLVLAVFFIGHKDASTAYISPEGFLFFNLGPIVQMLYVFVLSLAILPAINLVASKLRSPYSHFFLYGFIAETCGGIMLMTTKDAATIYTTGWVIGLVYIILLIATLNRKVLPETV